ncbi:hypothetical protein LR48_Vigan04g084800 [Vigna angularis]|uniref:DUF7725 domain-containing protein n=1 Tax=Phaseolus angularis TaxID=3914 RepID=A0A0L9UCK0_PHAAN|nr:hypothetical protein LR48_Vigan04g084800 [Vigna angularis]
MEATAAVAAAATAAAVRGVSLQMPPPSRKEWWAVADHHHSARNPDDETLGLINTLRFLAYECSILIGYLCIDGCTLKTSFICSMTSADVQELDNAKLGQSDERTIYEVQQGREPLDVDFCSITVDGTLDNDILQQQLHNVVRQRQELLQMEIDLKAQMIARTEIMDMRNSFDAQLKDNVNNTTKLQEQLCERERTIHDLERKMEEKERELHAIKLDNEAAWAKQDLLREQNKELATFRMERDHSEAERAQHIKQIHDLQEHIQEKDRQLIELQEQHRGAQETIMFKDEQLREAQAWIARVREMDVFQSTTNQTLQAELRERTEQYNQLWMGFQRQFAEMERVHLHTIQQLQLELADARERSGTYNDDSRISQLNSKSNATQFEHENGSQFDLNGTNASGGNNGLVPNESTDNGVPFSSTGNASIQTEHVPGVPITPSSLLVQPSYLPHGQVTALHPFVMHQQGVPNSVASHVPQSHVGHFHPVPSMSPVQQWQSQQSVSEGSQLPVKEHPSSSQTDQNLMRSDAKFSYEMSVNGKTLHRDYLDAHIQQGEGAQTIISSVTTETQVLQSVDKGQIVASPPDQSMQQISLQFSDALRLNSFEPNGEIKEQNSVTLSKEGPDDQVLLAEQASSATNASPVKSQSVNHDEMIQNNSTDSVLSEVFTSSGSTVSTTITKTSETALLDEKSLLACIVRTIPAGGRIRISSTLPNRLGKMLAPLHWHDYKRKYGKLDDFVGSHPELFLIEDDYIQLREVTPMAQSHRMKKVPSIDSKNIKSDKALEEYAVISSNLGDDPLKLSVMQHQQSNGPSFSVAGGLSNVKILSKSKDSREMDGPESRVVQSVGNGGSAQISGSANGRLVSSFTSKQQTRATGAVYPSRR